MIDVVCAVIINDYSEVMLARRSDKRDIGKWEFPGGKIEPLENLFEAIERELKEETGINVPYLEQFENFLLFFHHL